MRLTVKGKEIFNLELKSFSLPSFSDMVTQLFNPTGESITKTNAYKRHVWVYACINAVARNVARVPMQFFQKGSDKKTAKEVTTGPIPQLFQFVNPQLNQFQLKEGSMVFKLMTGEFFWHFNKLGDTVTSIDLLYPPGMKERLSDNQQELIGWDYSDGKIKESFSPEEILHVDFFNPYNKWRGLSPLCAAMFSVEIDDAARQFDKSILRNGSAPGGTIETEQAYSKPADERIKEDWKKRHSGEQKAGKIAVMWNGMKYKQITLTQKEVQYIEQKKMSRTEICAVYKVPPIEVGLFEDASFNNAREQVRMFWTTTLIPEMESVADDINTNFLDKGKTGLELRWDYSVIPELQQNLEEKIKQAESLWKMGVPLDAINEKIELGFDTGKWPWAKSWWIPLSLRPAEETIESIENPPVAPALPEPVEEEPEEDEEISEDAEKDYQIFVDNIGSRMKDVAAERRLFFIWRNFILQTDPIYRGYRKVLEKFFFELRSEVLSNFFSEVEELNFKKKGLEDSQLFDFEEDLKKLMALSTPFFEDAIIKGGNLVLEEIGVAGAFELVNSNTINFLNQNVTFLKGILTSYNEEIREVLSAGVEEGLPIKDIAENLTHKLNIVKSRAKRIARTEINGAANAGRVFAMDDNGIEEHQWLNSFDAKVRELHLIDQIVKVGEEFSLGLKWPGDKTGSGSSAGNIINCRCTTIAVLREVE